MRAVQFFCSWSLLLLLGCGTISQTVNGEKPPQGTPTPVENPWDGHITVREETLTVELLSRTLNTLIALQAPKRNKQGIAVVPVPKPYDSLFRDIVLGKNKDDIFGVWSPNGQCFIKVKAKFTGNFDRTVNMRVGEFYLLDPMTGVVTYWPQTQECKDLVPK